MEKLTDQQFLDVLQKKNILVSAKGQQLQVNAPAGAMDEAFRAEILRRKPDLMLLLERASVSNQPIEARAKDARAPLTPLQQGLWLLDHHQPGNVAYNIPEAFIVESKIDVEVLKQAVHQLLMRHEILRTSFHEQDGDLFQLVSEETEASVGLTDLALYSQTERVNLLNRLIREQARLLFDLRKAPLVRFHIFSLSGQQSVFFLNIHHIIADRKAVDVLREELMAFYAAILRGVPAELPPLPVQYGDYALWAEKQMTSDLMERQLKYWKRKLAGLAPFLNLPHSHPYPQTRTSWGATMRIEIPASLLDDLKKLGHQEGASSFMMFMAVFAALLHLYAEAEDFCIGSPSTLRKQALTERMVGVFVNTLPFRCQITQESTFRELVKQIRKTALEAYDNSDIPFQKLVSVLKPDRKPQRSPIFQVLLGYETNSTAPGQQQIDTAPGTARYDLTLNLYENAANVTGSIEYCTDLFDVKDIERLAEGLSIVEKAAREPDSSLSRFSN
ncbi:MAG: hypothetical protein JSS95_07475 [Acidobacteria bacterium]|nr:hypothetical protein [Acidobacteriota bacterium]